MSSSMNADQLKHLIREIPDFPKKGILFYDITTLLEGQDRVRHAHRQVGGALHCARTSIWCWAWRRAALSLRRRWPTA